MASGGRSICLKQLRKCLVLQQRSGFHKARRLNKGCVLGVYKPTEKDGDFVLTNTARSHDEKCGGQISKLLAGLAGKKLKKGGCRVLYDVHPEYSSVAVCCIDEQKSEQALDDLDTENIDEALDRVRIAAANGVRALRDIGEEEVDVDSMDNAQAAAEGTYLCLHVYDELKSEDKRKKQVDIQCIDSGTGASSSWQEGVCKAEGQNVARHLMEMPSNHLTPVLFAKTVQDLFKDSSYVTVTVRGKPWIEDNNMRSFLAVSQGSYEPPVFLEIEYKNPNVTDISPIALVGKGVTFDTCAIDGTKRLIYCHHPDVGVVCHISVVVRRGGISIKPAANMDQMRADMGGAACVVGSLYAIDKLCLPVNIHGFIPLCENMPGGKAIKPGDVVIARNGKSIQIDNTDAEGRLILADALDYAEGFNPQFILDMATLTGAIDVALGSAASGVYSTSNSLWTTLQQAGSKSGDRVWRMPLFNHYTKQVTESALADVNNIGKYSRSGGSCTAAAFLKEFVKSKKWLHLDIAGVMSNKDEIPYLGKGMSGRPTRTVVEFIQQLSKDKK